MLAYRLMHDVPFFGLRSFCPKCKNKLSWYELIPVISWFYLKAKCKNCNQNISFLYPFIEIFTALAMYGLFKLTPSEYWIAYFIFFSALIITIRTDLETMLISRFVTLFLIPVALVFSYFQMLPLSLIYSFVGAVAGYALLLFISSIFYFVTRKKGMGEGDWELMAFIGAFTGLPGIWFSLLIGSIIGSLFGLFAIIIQKLTISNKIPFGPFLSFGAIILVLFKDQIINIFLRL